MFIGLRIGIPGTLRSGGGVKPWQITRYALRDYLATTEGQPNPHSQPAMATPPTITTDTSGAPASTYARTITLATQAEVDTYCLIEGGKQTFAATTFMRPVAATMNASTVVNVASRISVTVNADAVAFYVVGTTQAYRFLVDDQYVDFTGTVPEATTGTGSNYIILTLASKAEHKVTIELQQGCAVRRIHIKNEDSFGAKPEASAHKGIVLGDSVTASTGASAFGDGYVPFAGDYLGVELWPSGVGATGYVNTNSGARYKLSERIAIDLDAFIADKGQPSIVTVAMGLNDLGLSGIQAEAETCFDIVREKCPAALVFVVNTWDALAPSPVSTDYNDVKSAIQAAVGSRGGFWFINPEGTAYTKSETVHPDTSGHQTLGLWLDAHIRESVA